MESLTNSLIFVLIATLLSIFNVTLIRYFSEGEKISRVMALVITAITAVSLYTALHFSDRPIAQVVFSTLLILTGGIDYKTKTIVTGTIYIGGFLAVVISLFYGKDWVDLLAGGAFGFAFYWVIYFVAKAYYKKEAFGFGDVIFMGAIGSYLGFWHALLSSVLTFYIALIFILLFAIIGKFMHRKTEIAFAPYMALSAWIVSIYGEELIKLYTQIFVV